MSRKSAKRSSLPPRPEPGPGAIKTGESPAPYSTAVSLAERATKEILAVSYWFDPLPHPEPYSVTVRFAGRHANVKGRVARGDQFIQDETIAEVVPGSGPISVTALVRGINPGEWTVTARLLEHAPSVRGRSGSTAAPPLEAARPSLVRLWQRWAPAAGQATPVHTCREPLMRVPGRVPLAWLSFVVLGMAVALITQSAVISTRHLAVGRAWLITVLAIVCGIMGAKAWYVVLHWHEPRLDRRLEGWCIQGFIVGATAAAAAELFLARVPGGVFLDATAPGLMFALAIGRVGCFFAGCCGGPPTAARWGVWSSDQRVGARRVPTQLLESLLAGLLGLASLLAVIGRGPSGGAIFVAALAAYTLARQGVLHLRSEPRRTKLGAPLTAAVAALVLVAAVIAVIR